MFAGLMKQAKDAVSGLVLKYVARASVAIPFVIALGFAVAAVTVMLVQRFGQVTAYWTMAGGLAAIGVIAVITVSVKEHEEEVAEEKAEASDTQEVVSDATAHAMVQAPLAMLGTMLTAPGGASTAIKVAGILGRNYPLVLLLVLIGALFWPTESDQTPETEAANLNPTVGSPPIPITSASAVGASPCLAFPALAPSKHPTVTAAAGDPTSRALLRRRPVRRRLPMLCTGAHGQPYRYHRQDRRHGRPCRAQFPSPGS